ncbi:MAG: LUD domain-containing protein [Flavobacteriaceae bacterium]|jgi:L-lactate utilization protein LutB|nr:LUD domain-containing protein [Flavobacteriaceae bacterium]MBT5232292.1 LUD domain-containing protein [Flavobacteriaceae bacterium]MBT5494059.1 LUD domain-containing protein [Flavobacteriaceae bacterium]MBT6654375.1 LUD domain-containing protein [Flavobacteriaceae bacterium]MDC0472075.1 lactate utilization protein [Flavobacteriaceae bacterium]|tara:strand:+ start:1170 stop:1706 length:537 start_codon:yes stop_codon:yes gene_type:complete
MPKIQDPIEERFTYNFTKNGGKFLYCEDKNECDEFFNKILEENNWKDVEILCYDDSLQNLFSKKSELLISKTNLNSKFFLTTCEFLVAIDGSLLICAEQIKSHKVNDLPKNFIVFAKISQFTETLSLGLNGIKSKYPKNLPTNITTIKNFNSEEKENTNFLTYGSSAKNLYLLLLEDL